MSELELFDSRGRFVLPSPDVIAKMDEATRERWLTVAEAAQEHDAIAADLKAAESRVTELMEQTHDLDAYIRENFPAQSREAAIREYLATERAKRGM
jgi:arginine deiminase